ncbi:MAG: tol-pal system-associated acyl-CoA thioesterase [Caulobacterales bacterium]|uniref:tol-pal system-associated acyl-CoA thioesterase n=1 Tax=Glycocaulis sp. TaxID=1969725 RepID=UPI003FA04C65
MTVYDPQAGYWRDGAHYLPVRVYYEDTDFTGIVYYANYLKFLERGRTDALRTAGLSHAQLLQGDPPLGFAVRKVTVEYHAPARIDDALVVETRFSSLTGVRMAIEQTVTREGVLLASAEVEAVCIDLDGRPKRLPAGLKDALGKVARG